MAKIKVGLLSLGARGSISKAITFLRRGGQRIVEKKPELKDVQSEAQLGWRHMFLKVVVLWHALSAAEKLEWERLARPRHMTGYAWFVSQALRPNPGIYLPLQGGTMAGDIDMAKNRLLKLPLPTDNQEAASKAYVDALAPGLHAATHENGGADEIGVGGLSGLLADDQHILDAEAVSAMGVKGDANPLHHNRYINAEAQAVADARIAIHAALPNVHHTPAAGVLFTELAGGENHSATANAAWEDWDLSGIIGAGAASVLVGIAFFTMLAYGVLVAGARKNGSALLRYAGIGQAPGQPREWDIMLLTECDANRVIEIYAQVKADIYFNVLGYWS